MQTENQLITKKITLATVKKFIRENASNLYANCTSSFDGMTDCVERRDDGFIPVDASKINMNQEHDLGIERLWFVRGGRDYFKTFENDTLQGYTISNSCGSSIIAIPKTNA